MFNPSFMKAVTRKNQEVASSLTPTELAIYEFLKCQRMEGNVNPVIDFWNALHDQHVPHVDMESSVLLGTVLVPTEPVCKFVKDEPFVSVSFNRGMSGDWKELGEYPKGQMTMNTRPFRLATDEEIDKLAEKMKVSDDGNPVLNLGFLRRVNGFTDPTLSFTDKQKAILKKLESGPFGCQTDVVRHLFHLQWGLPFLDTFMYKHDAHYLPGMIFEKGGKRWITTLYDRAYVLGTTKMETLPGSRVGSALDEGYSRISEEALVEICASTGPKDLGISL